MRIASAVTPVHLEMRLKVISPRDVELLFTVPIVIISKSQEGYEQRLIEVEWDERNANKSYLAEIDIYGL